jgi:DNA repair exonuclease SbcCD ATPase subunit
MRLANVLPGHNREFYTDNPEEVVTKDPGQLVEDVEQLQEHHEHVLDKYEDEIRGLDDSLHEQEALVKELNQAKSIIEDNISMLKSVRDRYVLHDVSVQGIRGDTFGDLVDEIQEHLVNVKRLSKADMDDKADKVSEQVDELSVRVQACRQILASLINLLQQYPTQEMEEIIDGLREQAKALIEQAQRRR